jgi:hypothetical protein
MVPGSHPGQDGKKKMPRRQIGKNKKNSIIQLPIIKH